MIPNIGNSRIVSCQQLILNNLRLASNHLTKDHGIYVVWYDQRTQTFALGSLTLKNNRQVTSSMKELVSTIKSGTESKSVNLHIRTCLSGMLREEKDSTHCLLSDQLCACVKVVGLPSTIGRRSCFLLASRLK